MQHATQQPPSLVAQVPGMPKEVETVLFTALAKDYQERFVTVQAFVTALQYASAPPTLRQFAAPGTNRPFAEVPLAPAPPSALFPPAGGQVPLAIPSSVPPSAMPITKYGPETSASRETMAPVSDAPDQKLSSRSLANERALPPARTRAFLKAGGVLLVLLVVLLIAGTVWARNGIQTPAKPRAYPTATAIVRTTPTVPTTATVAVKVDSNSYNVNVARQGIMFGFDAEHTHNNSAELLLSVTNVSHLHQAWVAPTGNFLYSSPAIANGMVYVGSEDRNFYAFNAASGQQKWSAYTYSPIDSSPAVANGVVYVGSCDHRLYAFDAATGRKKWAASTGGCIGSSPTVVNGVVYVSSKDHKLYAFSLSKNAA